MPELIHKVLRAEFYTARDKWNKLYNNHYWQQQSFMRFIGLYDFEYVIGRNVVMCTETAFRKIEMLNSPHAYALMKAFIARTGYHKKLPEK